MSIKQIVTYSTFALALAAGSAAMAADHSHNNQGSLAKESALTLDHGKKWQTDAPLRQGMEGIRKEMSTALPAIHKNSLSAEQYKTLTSKIENHLGDIVKNCKLTPEADAQLHVVIGQISQGTEGLKTGSNRHQAATQIMQALDAYGKHFDHPNWSNRKGG